MHSCSSLDAIQGGVAKTKAPAASDTPKAGLPNTKTISRITTKAHKRSEKQFKIEKIIVRRLLNGFTVRTTRTTRTLRERTPPQDTNMPLKWGYGGPQTRATPN
jgi:hypothetical protein